MSHAPNPDLPNVRPSPGALKALGILNIVFALLSLACISSSAFWLFAASSSGRPVAEIQIQVQASPAPQVVGTITTSKPTAIGFDPFMGMDDKNFVRFCVASNGIDLLTNGLMFATGIGLLNCRRWAARWWTLGAWTKIALALGVWAYYIVAVAPGFSELMARNVAAMFTNQAIAPGRGPTVADLTRLYSIMNLILALLMMVAGSLYPAISVWALGRTRLKAALIDAPKAGDAKP